MVRSQATTMKSRNRNGRSHAAFSAFDKPLSRFSSATSRSLVIVFFGGEFNPLDKYWQAGFRAAICALAVVPAKAGTHSHYANCRSKTNGYRLKSRGAAYGFQERRVRPVDAPGAARREMPACRNP